jgi:hypothetical protein
MRFANSAAREPDDLAAQGEGHVRAASHARAAQKTDLHPFGFPVGVRRSRSHLLAILQVIITSPDENADGA